MCPAGRRREPHCSQPYGRDGIRFIFHYASLDTRPGTFLEAEISRPASLMGHGCGVCPKTFSVNAGAVAVAAGDAPVLLFADALALGAATVIATFGVANESP